MTRLAAPCGRIIVEPRSEVVLRVTEYDQNAVVTPASRHTPGTLPKPPAGLVACRLIAAMRSSDRSLVYVAVSESSAARIAEALHSLDPGIHPICLPPWDCLPYDRVPPSRQCMGRRMDALRVWSEPSTRPKLLIASLDAMLQRVAPKEAIADSWFELNTGMTFDRTSFDRFVGSMGYVEDGLVDEPGEYAFRDDVIDIFPAGQREPMRIVLTDDGLIAAIRSYDPETQRTVRTRETMIFGPASEAVLPGKDMAPVDGQPISQVSESKLFHLYGSMQTVFDCLGDARIAFSDGLEARLETSFELIEDARQAAQDFRRRERDPRQSLYLDRAEWTDAVKGLEPLDLSLGAIETMPTFATSANPRLAFLTFVLNERNAKRTVVVAGQGRLFDSLCRRIERHAETSLPAVVQWSEVAQAEPGTILKMTCPLEQGFIDAAMSCTVVTVRDIMDGSADEATTHALFEPELALGDVVVHEDHGIGILHGLETIDIDRMMQDTARLTYRDGASVLVPMEEFGKLWRYGSEPEAVTLDRLHTDAWQIRKATIVKDLRTAARHLIKLTRDRRAGSGTVFVPPRTDYTKFVGRFPYMLTADQGSAVDAILADLGSGRVMNRLVCGDVGFGKTEVALRAAAAVALAGGQAAVIAPTTVLARQHFQSFERRFAQTGVRIALLSRVVTAKDAKAIKADLASGGIGIVVATHAILAKDIAFANLGLVIVDEEHRFGVRDKQTLRSLAPRLHTLMMSATPIPRTLQAAMVGIQEVSLLATAPSKRRPVRTSVSPFDRAAMRIALMREYRRRGQSFVVVPQIADLKVLETILHEVVPELTVRVAHGKMPAAAMDDIMVGFAEGDGDVLLSTNIIESGLDVPLANTIFIWRADRFGSAQLHQLRGRVGRGKVQGAAYLLTAPDEEISEDSLRRLTTLVRNDRLGAGLAISLNDLDLRGAGDLTGDDQAGHMRMIGAGLYHRLMEQALAMAGKRMPVSAATVVLNLGLAGTIPESYVPDAAVRLNLHARLLRAQSVGEIDGFAYEFEDRFGELPQEVLLLLRLARLKIAAGRFGASRLDAGPRALAIGFDTKPLRSTIGALSKVIKPVLRETRLIYDMVTETAQDRLLAFERLLSDAGHPVADPPVPPRSA